MRNTGPFIAQHIINDKILPMVDFIKTLIHLAERIWKQRQAFFHQLMGLIFKISEERLPVEGGANIIQLIG